MSSQASISSGAAGGDPISSNNQTVTIPAHAPVQHPTSSSIPCPSPSFTPAPPNPTPQQKRKQKGKPRTNSHPTRRSTRARTLSQQGAECRQYLKEEKTKEGGEKSGSAAEILFYNIHSTRNLANRASEAHHAEIATMGSPIPACTVDPLNPNTQHWENGLALFSEFITPQEEAEIIRAILSDDRWAGIGKRQTLHYGAHFDYTTFGASELYTPIPKYLEDLVERLPLGQKEGDGRLDQFTVQYYPPGTGIPPHVDTHSVFGEYLWSLSVGSAVPMVFKRCGENEARKMRRPKRSLLGGSRDEVNRTRGTVKAEDDGEERWEVWLEERSLLLMRGEARFGFTHMIRGRKFDERRGEKVRREGRWSITMRSVRRGVDVKCECRFPGVCDARIKEEMERERQKEIEKEKESNSEKKHTPENNPT
ncbi:hypothetical protein EYC80_005126 [Monilinia laxa]|uniref:Fe2OG dioxygenase domain-containing protein n=1 Tax=Monilinia laxa TaxID=61186 RepID=A0A5N6KIX8_MONLA|nr:hypothetical protein EYC80_005126 [Monilinia laxa]